MKDIYEECLEFENEKYTLRFVLEEDCMALYKVYSDENAVPFFNSDNCHGDDFHYTSLNEMKEAIDFWHRSYGYKAFVRWTIFDKRNLEAIGTIELFHRNENDYFTNCGVLRVDLRSDYEKSQEIENMLSLILEPAFHMFHCDKIATKAIPLATERRTALSNMGFLPSNEKLIGYDGTMYDSYFVLMNQA